MDKDVIVYGDMDGIKRIFNLNYQAYVDIENIKSDNDLEMELFNKGKKLFKKNMMMILDLIANACQTSLLSRKLISGQQYDFLSSNQIMVS